MSESATDVASGPSLEQILWRSLDQWTETPGLVDRDEFAAHIAGAFDGDMPSEAFVERFFSGDPLERMRAPSDMAEAIVRGTRDRLQVYEFDLRQLEYVIVEDKEKMVVVSDFGQFAIENNDVNARAIEAAIIPRSEQRSSQASLDRGGEGPRVYLVRASGEVVAVDVKKIAKALDAIAVKQVETPAVDRPGSRMLPFAPVKRRLSESREERALRQDLRTRQALPEPPMLRRRLDRGDSASAGSSSLPPAGAATTVFVLLPDGSLARPSMGSATRWQDMVSDWSLRAQALSSFGGGGGGGSQAAVAVSSTQRFAVSAGQVVALFSSSGSGNPGSLGERASARANGIVSARADSAPIRVLGDDELARAVAAGAMVVPGKAASLPGSGGFWIQPEAAFAPSSSQRERVLTQGGDSVSLQQAAFAQGGEPLQLGQITGDPWADWALAGGGESGPAALMAAIRGRANGVRAAAIGRDAGSDDFDVPALRVGSAAKSRQLLLGGAQVVAFRAADGSVIVQRDSGSIRLAARSRGDTDVADGDGSQQRAWSRSGRAPLALRSGAIPATALAALQTALERTANAGSYKLPLVKLESASDAIEAGSALQFDATDGRRGAARLAGPVYLRPGAGGQVAQMVLSMPFPNGGEVHVGADLSEALQAYLGAPVLPAGSSGGGWAAPAVGGAAGAGAGALLLNLRGGGAPSSGAVAAGAPLGGLDFGSMHGAASQRAEDAYVTLDLPSVRPLLSRSASVSGLPTLLQTALAQSGDWTPGPGSPMPSGVRRFALQGPFDLPELVAGGAPDASAPAERLRALNPGEDEIVIPMPLWSQMGRGRLSSTEQVMASPLAPRGYAPPLGVYRLVSPEGGFVDQARGAPAGARIVEIAGPTGLELGTSPTIDGTGVSARSLGGRRELGRALLDDGRRGRLRIGAPLDPAVVASRGLADRADVSPGSNAPAPTATSWPQAASSSPRTAVSQGSASSPSSGTVLGSAPQLEGTYIGSSFVSTGSSARPMAGALQSSLRFSSDVSARVLPAGSSASLAASAPGGSAAAFSSRAASAAARMQGSFVGGSSGVASGSAADSSLPGQISLSAAASGARDVRSASATSTVVGLSPGAWSGARPQDTGYQAWSYSPHRSSGPIASGGVSLSGLSRPTWPSLPTALRFRYVGAPLWWSGSTAVAGSAAAVDGDGPSEDLAPTRAMRAGVRAANSAAAIWRSIFVSGGSAQPGSKAGSGGTDDATGGMDGGWDSHAAQMGSLGSRMDAMAGAAIVGGGAAGALAGKGSETVYVAMNGSGGAGAVRGSDVQRARAQALEMSIVAAIPPAPPPLEASGSGGGADAPHARHRGHGKHDEHKEGADAVSHSKIEGSVDAVAQRIYHRIRRRIQSDRERFGG